MDCPQVSVLTLTRNRPQFLDRAIQSVIGQTLEDWELIVVHDGQDQQTAALMEQWVQRDPRIRYFHRDSGGNIANACNYGLAQAHGQYVAILDDDDYWVAADKLAKQVAFLDSHPDYAGCGGGMTVIDDDENVLMSYLKPEPDDEIRARALLANPMTHSTSMFRRSLGEAIGYYDESLAGYQDWDIWLRLGRLGKLYNFPELFTRYTLWSSGGSFQQQRRNALSALKIVFRHRAGYGGFTGALALAITHLAYAHLPSGIRKSSFSFLSQRKKAIFAGKQKRTASEHRSSLGSKPEESKPEEDSAALSAGKVRSFVSAAAFVLTTAYVVLAHLSPAVLFPHPAQYSIMVWLAAAATLACLSQFLSHRLLWLSPQLYLMLGLTVAVPVSLVANGQARDALRGLREFLVSGVVFYLVFAAVDTLRKMRMLAFAVVLSAIYLLSQSLVGWYLNGIYSPFILRQHIYNAQGDVIGEFPRLQSVGILEDPNALAQYLLVAASLLTLAWAPGRWRRNLALVMLPAAYLLYGILVTHSRGGLIGLAILVFFLLEKRFGKIISFVLSGSLLCLLFWAGAGGPRSISHSDPATAGRIGVWQSGIGMFRSSPVFGVGFQMFRVHNPSLTAHNSLLLCLAELGMFGGLLWLGVIVFSLWDLNRIAKNDRCLAQNPELARSANGVRIALFTFLGTGCFLSSTYVMTLYVLIGMAAAARPLFRRQI